MSQQIPTKKKKELSSFSSYCKYTLKKVEKN